MNAATNQSIQNLVSIVKDYQRVLFNEDHVKRWLRQFDQEDHDLILHELSVILKKTYLSKAKETDFLTKICTSLIKFKENEHKELKFLDIQTSGGSQKHLLKRLDEVIKENSNYSLSNLEASSQIKRYVYLDDAIYTGNKVIRDIKSWSKDIDVSTVEELDIVVYASHEENSNYVKSELEKTFPKSRIGITSALKFNINDHECYSLSGDVILSEGGKTYVDQIVGLRSEPQEMFYPLLRKVKKYDEGYFSNDENRKRIELIFFEKGLEITFSAKEQFRPFGYDFHKTLGFGSYLINYRNIANNCPAVFWWGDLEGHKGINNWYPLFPRKANN
ncbi:phosphoribosyltransferase-like protein [Bacillus altitudinis]|uniref:phosphoribosyltransferase-like protein n=1 Tax=Bacillus altitudinis TaxID=293387 RepID=UPI000BC32A28|nr:hypothetical protein [Bacillus altitudinis]ATH71808.1 hypothetical protein CFN77_06275 [Bacillus altitudinis]